MIHRHLILNFYDRLFVRIYKFYFKNCENDTPIWLSMFLMTLFQCFNVLSVMFLLLGIFSGKYFKFPIQAMLIVLLLDLFFNCIRTFKIIGFGNLIDKYYNETNKGRLHPFGYFLLSLLILLTLRFFGFFPAS